MIRACSSVRRRVLVVAWSGCDRSCDQWGLAGRAGLRYLDALTKRPDIAARDGEGSAGVSGLCVQLSVSLEGVRCCGNGSGLAASSACRCSELPDCCHQLCFGWLALDCGSDEACADHSRRRVDFTPEQGLSHTHPLLFIVHTTPRHVHTNMSWYHSLCNTMSSLPLGYCSPGPIFFAAIFTQTCLSPLPPRRRLRGTKGKYIDCQIRKHVS